MKILNGTPFATFEQCALAMGLLNASDAFDASMREAVQHRMPYQLRALFVSLFVFFEPSTVSANRMWDKYKGDLSEDYSRRGNFLRNRDNLLFR